MKKIWYLTLILVFIFITASCSSKNSSGEEKNNNPPANIPIKYNPGTTQSTDQTPQPSASPSPTITPAPQKDTEKSTPNKRNNEAPKKVASPKASLGSYKTPLLNKSKNRVDNIRLAAKRINGCKVKPGAIFSFNNVVGKRDSENGFKVATIIVKGEYSEDMGGGVCQLSSTLYNAVDKAKLEVLERHTHSRAVGYLPKGRDAAISFGYLDFRFKNNKDYPVEIKAWIENNEVHVSIYKAK